MTYQIINGDCIEEMGKMQNKSVDHILTSPPYNRKRNDKYTNYVDIVQNYYGWQEQCIIEMLRISRGYVIYNIQTNYYNRQDVYKLMGRFHKEIKDIIIWEKTNPMPASGMTITNAVEFFIILGEIPLRSNRTYTKNIISTSVNSKMPKEHKAVMKQEVSDFFVNTFTQEGDLILDPFMGTGTTGVSCVRHSRRFIGFEIDQQYCDMSQIRLSEEEAINLL